MRASDRVAQAARACVGAPFRLHGRDPATGLDCVGLAAIGLGAVRPLPPVPTGYSLRGDSLADALAWALEAGLTPAAPEERRPGTLLVCLAGPFQHHLAITTPAGIVHADLGLRRVVERPGGVPWPVLAAWIIGEGEG